LVDLVLYVSGSSPASSRALANLKRILTGYTTRSVTLSVCDVSAEPLRAEADQIAFTPTLCKRAPEPPMWIVGDLSNPRPLTDLLDFYGVHASNAHRQTHHRRSRV
jgi:circadian clock protein KaiB